MGMSMYERQVLSGIERELRREDPRLAAYLDQLGPTDPVPPTRGHETPTWRHRRRGLLAMVSVLVAFMLGVLAVAALAPPQTARGGAVHHDQQRPAESCPGPNHLYPTAKCVEEPAYYPPDGGSP